MPGAELVLRVRDLVPSPDTTIVVNCAGRTRSIIGAQSLIDAGVPNKVMALRNGTMGWHLAGLACASGKSTRVGAIVRRRARLAKVRAADVARRFDIQRIDRATLDRFSAEREPHDLRLRRARSVRIRAGPCARRDLRARRATGAGDRHLSGTLGARIVLSDDREVRAMMTASWLKRMGWADLFVLAEAGGEIGMPETPVLGRIDESESLEPKDVDLGAVTVIDLSTSANYRRGHIAGAWFAIRSRLDRALTRIAPQGEIVLTSEDGLLAGLAVAEVQALTPSPCGGSKAAMPRGAPPACRSRPRSAGRRSGRLLAQALRAAERSRGRDERLSLLGGRSPGPHQAKTARRISRAR